MITIVDESSIELPGFIQFIMLIPFLFVFYFIAFIAETCSLLSALRELNLEAVHEVLLEMEDTEEVVEILRTRIIDAAYNNKLIGADGPKEFISSLFAAIDRDKSGYIDRDEFRELLRSMHLTFRSVRSLLYCVG